MLTLDEIKTYLRLESNFEDDYLLLLMLLSQEICSNYLRCDLPDPLPESVRQAQLLLIGYFFEHRDGTKDGIPTVVFTLLDPYRKAAF